MCAELLPTQAHSLKSPINSRNELEGQIISPEISGQWAGHVIIVRHCVFSEKRAIETFSPCVGVGSKTVSVNIDCVNRNSAI